MISCLPEHIGVDDCPECESGHGEVSILPERLLTIPDCRQLIQEKEIDGIMPIFRIHTEEAYQKAIPAVVLVSGTEVSALWNNPRTDTGWVTAFEETDVEYPFELGEVIGDSLRENTYMEDTIEGREVVQPDQELTEAVANS